MTDPKPSYEELEARLARAEGMLEAIRSGQVDTVLGDESELVVRLAETEAALRERVKELDCLYSISHLAEEADSLAEILSGTAGIIPASWRFPEVCCTRIVLGDEVHRCGPPCGQACESCTHPCISEPVRVNGLPAGEVRVCYIDERPAADEGPFLAEERRLLRGIAEHLGRVARRFRMETALRRSEARFRSLVEEMPVMINAITPQGDFTYWNRACEEVTGYAREEVIGSSEVYTWMYPNPDYRERLAREWAENGHRFDGKETTLVARDGSLRHTIWSNLPPEVSPGGDQHWAIGVDITERKQAEEALRHNEAMLRRTEAIANVGSWEWEIEQDYVRWSEELFRIFGRDPAEGAPTFAEHPKIYPAEDMERLRKAVDACASEGTPYEVELRAVRPDGEIRHCIARGRAERDADGYIHRLVGSLQDITARKRAEEEVRRTNEQLRGTLESIGDGFFSLDGDLRATYFNAAAERLLGRSRDDVLGRPLFEAFPEAQGSVFEENYRRALSQRERVAFEVYFDVPPYRNWYAVTVYPAENGISVYFQVITARKEAEDALRRSEENHRTTLNSIGDAVIATDTGGHVREMNPVAERLTGWTADEAMRRPLEEVFEIVNARSRERVSNPVERVLATGRIVGLANHTLLINRDGTERQIADSAAPIVNDAGEVSGVVLVFRDVTEEYAAAEQLRFQAAILARISDLVTVTDPAGRILYVNDAECRMQGRAREEIVGAPVASYGEDPEKGATQEEIVSATLRDGEWRGEVVNHTADGREVILDCRTQAMRDEEGGLIALVGIATDITEQKRNEEALRESEGRFRTVFEESPLGIGLLTVEDQQLIRVNAALAGMLGYGVDELAGKTVPELTHPDDRAEEARQVGAAVHAGAGSVSVEKRLITRSGEVRWVRVTGGVLPYREGGRQIGIGIVEDITERRKMEEALRESEEHFRNLFENMTAGVAVYEPVGDGDDFVFADLNAAGERASKVSREEVLGRRVTEVFPAVGEIGLLECFRRAYRTGEPQLLPLTLYEDERVQEWVENRVFRLPSGRIVAIYEDRTEQHQLEERMRQMEKMESIGQLAGGVAHDFNNQLAGIMGYSDILLARLEEPVFRGYVENILVSARRAADLTQQLLAFSRKGAYRNVPVDVHEVIHEVVGILEHSIDRRIAIRQRLEAASRAVQGDPTQIQSALLNLALNARDAMPDGGEIRFETRDATLSPESCESLPFELEPGRYLLVRVCDTGCGMAPEVRDHVFEPFYTTKEVGQGTGMGLAAVYGTVKHHRGAVAVDSEAGEGSTFTLYLPVIEAGPDEPEEPESAAEKLEGLRVLVIDDEEILRTLGVELLQDLGCEAHAEPDGEAGVAWFREHHEEVDAVILDMIMPRLSGEDAFSALREIDPGATILLASGYSASGGAEALLARGAAGFLQKPFQQAQLASKLAEAIGAS